MDRFVVRAKRLPVTGEELASRKRPAASAFPRLEAEVDDTLGKQPHKADDRRNLSDDTNVQDSPAEQNKPHSTLYKSLDLAFPTIKSSSLQWKKILMDNLDLDYTLLFPREVADGLVRVFEDELDYFTGDLAKIQIFGRWHNIPRKQV